MSLVEQELLTLPEHLSSPPVFSGVRVTRFLAWYVCFVDRCLSFCTFSFGHCVVCSSATYGFWLPLWYLQALLTLKGLAILCRSCFSLLIVFFQLFGFPILWLWAYPHTYLRMILYFSKVFWRSQDHQTQRQIINGKGLFIIKKI